MLDGGAFASAPSQWRSTAWSMIAGAQGDGEHSRQYLEQLCRTYWKPAYYYARRRGMNHHDASDCIQEFFARMLAGDWLRTVDRERGTFRGWLLTALRRWVSRSRTATGMDRLTIVHDDVVKLYEKEDEDASPEHLFNKSWAQSCLDEALRLMHEEQRATSREIQVAVFARYLEETSQSNKVPSYDMLSEAFDIPVTTVTNYLHRARALFRTYLLRTVRETIDNPDDAETELELLRSYLS